MENWPRVFVYTTLSLTIGVAIYLFTHNFYRYVETPGIVRYITLGAYFVIYANMSFVLSRRFSSKTIKGVKYPYVLGVLIVLPTIIFIILQPQSGVHKSQPLLFIVLLIASLAGSHLGIKNGIVKRNMVLSKLDGDKIPDSLRQSDESISKN